MRKIKVKTNVTIFLLFFGVAGLEAIESADWLRMLFWLAIGAVFLGADQLISRSDRARTERTIAWG